VQELDVKDDVNDLSINERLERKNILAELSKGRIKQEAVAYQKAKCKWLKQGDMNTKYFLAVTKWRRSKNGLNGILENGDWVEEPETIKRKIKEFFEMRFREGKNIQVKLDDIRINNISEEDNVMLTRKFSEEEIKEAIYGHVRGQKSPGPDDYNFDFLKFS